MNSVMICGIDNWRVEDTDKVVEPTLARSLRVNGFRAPPPADDETPGWSTPEAYISAVRFPAWLVCSRCDRLGKVGSHFHDRGKQPRCAASSCDGRGVPVRLVSACFSRPGQGDHPGHIDDFPWIEWCHSRMPEPCRNPQLKLVSTADSVGLAGLQVVCFSKECNGKARRSLQNVFGEEALSFLKCRGARPWLEDDEPGCDRPVRALMRGASNAYFPVTASALSIPPNSSRLVGLVGKTNRTIIDMWQDGKREDAILYFKKGAPKARHYSNQQIGDAFRQVLGGSEDEAPLSEKEQRSKERKSIIEGRTDGEEEGSEFSADPVNEAELDNVLYGTLQSLVLVDRLREVRAIRGFQRVDRSHGGDSYTRECAPIFKKDPGWLPAVEVRGEGVFFELDQGRVSWWSNLQEVEDRLAVLHRNLVSTARLEGNELDPEDFPSARFVLIHTLSHLVINQLSLECGYSSASLRERIYADDDDDSCGVLVSTSAPGADGTLGGLVRQGRPQNFDKVLREALVTSMWCSSDPLCSENQGQGPGASNLAACHACCLVSETSCEHNNAFLDRGFLVGNPGNRRVGFFSEWLVKGEG